jgi:hypothetical protein
MSPQAHFACRDGISPWNTEVGMSMPLIMQMLMVLVGIWALAYFVKTQRLNLRRAVQLQLELEFRQMWLLMGTGQNAYEERHGKEPSGEGVVCRECGSTKIRRFGHGCAYGLVKYRVLWCKVENPLVFCSYECVDCGTELFRTCASDRRRLRRYEQVGGALLGGRQTNASV